MDSSNRQVVSWIDGEPTNNELTTFSVSHHLSDFFILEQAIGSFFERESRQFLSYLLIRRRPISSMAGREKII